MSSGTHRADERRFLDERGGTGALAPNGLNPATILEKAVRERIVESYFWKEQCFGVNEADIIDRVTSHVSFIGGSYGGEGIQRPSPFLCLAFKLLQLAPDDDVLDVYLNYGGEKFKYLRALACFYIRLTRPAEVVFKSLEPFLEDRRKLRRRGRKGTTLSFVDEFVDELLTKDRVCATSLWKMPSREILEDLDKLDPRISPLGDIEDLLDDDDENENDNDKNGDGSQESGEDRGGRDRDVDMDDATNDRGRGRTNGVSGDGSGEEGEIESDRRRRSRSRSSANSERSRRYSRERSYSRDGRMHVDRDRWSDRSASRDRRRSRSQTRSRSRSRSDSR